MCDFCVIRIVYTRFPVYLYDPGGTEKYRPTCGLFVRLCFFLSIGALLFLPCVGADARPKWSLTRALDPIFPEQMQIIELYLPSFTHDHKSMCTSVRPHVVESARLLFLWCCLAGQGRKPGRYQPPHRNPNWKPPPTVNRYEVILPLCIFHVFCKAIFHGVETPVYQAIRHCLPPRV